MKRYIAVLSAVLMLISLFPAFSFAGDVAASGVCGADVTWTLDGDGLLTISGSGPMYDYAFELSGQKAPWLETTELAQSVKSLVVAEGVTSIGDEAFYRATEMESISLPASVRSIGSNAFRDCFALQEAVLPEGLVSIGGNAFYGCASLHKLVLPDSVENIGATAFYACYALNDLSIGRGLTQIRDSVFRECTSLENVLIPEGITTIGPYAFYGCSNLLNVTVPDSVVSIQNKAFAGCDKLHILCSKNSAARAYAEENGFAYGLPDGYTEENIFSGSYENMQWLIDRRTCILHISCEGDMPAFGGIAAVPWLQEGLKNYIHTVLLEDGITSVSDFAFYGCDAMTVVSVPDSVRSIGASAFYGCEDLIGLALPEGVVSIGRSAFQGCSALKEISLPSSLQTIGTYAFFGCASLPFAALPEGLTRIFDYTFASCTGMTGVVIPDSITNIGAYAFSGSGLTSAELPVNVADVGAGAFSRCENLETVTFYNKTCRIGNEVAPDQTVICGYTGSTAETYAGEHGQTFRPLNAVHEHHFVTVKTVAPTCVRSGLYTLKCACGEQQLIGVPATGRHTPGKTETTVVVQPTCVDAGEEKTVVFCEVCGKTVSEETAPIAPTGVHTLDMPVETVVRAATCTQPGERLLRVQCTVCGETVWESTAEIPMLSHTDANNDGACDACGAHLGDPCQYCGKVHGDTFFEKLVALFHRIAYFFRSLGNR